RRDRQAAHSPGGPRLTPPRLPRRLELHLPAGAPARAARTARPGRHRPRRTRPEVPRAFRTVHPLGWTIWKGEVIAPTEEELLAGIQGRSREDGDRDLAPDRPSGEGARYQRRHPRKLGWHIPP